MTSTMRDREFVNRFCAFQILELSEYRDMDEFLAKGLKKMNATPDSLPALSFEFRRSLENNFNLFGKHAFRKHNSGQETRSVVNASLWDVMSTGLSRYQMNLVRERADTLRAAFFRLMEDENFLGAITYGPNDPKKVRYRFRVAAGMFEEVFGADAS